jgi:hypothetical protein
LCHSLVLVYSHAALLGYSKNKLGSWQAIGFIIPVVTTETIICTIVNVLKSTIHLCLVEKKIYNFFAFGILLEGRNSLKIKVMKMMSTLLEAVIDKVEAPGQSSSAFVVVLVVLALGAGSLYILLNTPA